jgi:hypothetical protein
LKVLIHNHNARSTSCGKIIQGSKIMINSNALRFFLQTKLLLQVECPFFGPAPCTNPKFTELQETIRFVHSSKLTSMPHDSIHLCLSDLLAKSMGRFKFWTCLVNLDQTCLELLQLPEVHICKFSIIMVKWLRVFFSAYIQSYIYSWASHQHLQHGSMPKLH